MKDKKAPEFCTRGPGVDRGFGVLHDYDSPSGTEWARWSRMLRRLVAAKVVIVCG